MDAKTFTQMLTDNKLHDLKKLQYKYSPQQVSEMITLMKDSMYSSLPIRDFKGQPVFYRDANLRISINAVKLLIARPYNAQAGGIDAMEDEIHNTLKIENINSSRTSIRRILNGYLPKNDGESRILGMKSGLEFISDQANKITEENLHKLYLLTIADFLSEEDRLLPGALYRHDRAYVVGGGSSHEGISREKLPEYMKDLFEFIHSDFDIDDLLKAALIHFYFAFLHPYFDGNGRTARLLHLWYLVQKGYPSAMYIPFSSYISETRSDYLNRSKAINMLA